MLTPHIAPYGAFRTLLLCAALLLGLAQARPALAAPQDDTRQVTQQEYTLFNEAKRHAERKAFAKADEMLNRYFAGNTGRRHLFGYELYSYVLLQIGGEAAITKAVRILEEGTAAHPGNSGLLLNLGTAYAQSGQPLKAAEAYLQTYALEGRTNHPLVFSAAALLAGAGRPGEAYEALAPLKDLPEARDDWFVLLGQCALRMKKPGHAAEVVRTGLRRYPEHTNLWRMLGHAHMQEGNREQAAAAFGVAHKLAPASEEEKRQLASLYSSIGAPIMGKETLGQVPATAQLLDHLAFGLARTGDLPGALDKAQQALTMEPTAERRFRKGQILLRMRRMDEARQVFSGLAAEKGRWQGKAQWALCIIAWQEGDWQAAKSALEVAAQSDDAIRKRALRLMALLETVTTRPQ